MRLKFDEQLETLNQQMIRMGMLCETAIRTAAESLTAHDMKKAADLPDLEAQINQMRSSIENICLRLLLQQQPVAKDLRTVSSALKMVTDMDRIGVQSADIAEIVTMDTIHDIDERLPIKTMSENVIRMVTESIDAFIKKDEELARSVVYYDDIVDDEFDQMRSLLIEALKTPGADGGSVLDLLMIAKYLERIGDHAVNIAEWVLFSITGKHEDV